MKEVSEFVLHRVTKHKKGGNLHGKRKSRKKGGD